MIETSILEAAIKPGTSQSLINHILFTNAHHCDGKTQDEIVAKWKGAVIGEFIDFNKLEAGRASKAATGSSPVAREVSKEDAIRDLCGEDLFNIMFGSMS